MAKTVNFTIEQGATFKCILIWLDYETRQPKDLTGYTAALQVRESYGAAEALVSLTSEPGGGIEIIPLEGRMNIVIEAVATAALPAPKTGVYDLLVTAPAEMVRLIEGGARITPRVTR